VKVDLWHYVLPGGFFMFFNSVVRLVKCAWGIPLAVMAVLFTAVMILITLVGGGVCALVVPPDRNPFRGMVWLYGWVIRHVILRAAGIQVFVDQATRPLAPGERAVIAATHGSLVGMMVQVWATEAYGFGPVLWVIKKESMRWWSIGSAMAKIGRALDIDRSNPLRAIRRMQAVLSKGLCAGSVQILIEGTRPTVRGIGASQTYYRDKLHRPDWAAKLLYTCRPKHAGFQQALKSMPHERVIRLMVTSSIHEEGFRGFFELIGNGAVFVRIEEWSEPLNPESLEGFFDPVNIVWTGRVQEWIAEKRAQWHKRKWWQRWYNNAP